MIDVIGVRFREVGKIYYFDPNDYNVDTEDYVIVETMHGVEFSKVVITNRRVDEEDVLIPLQKLIRLATEQDILEMTENSELDYKAFNIEVKKIERHKLDMTLVDAGYTFDRNKVIFDFTSEGRVDFRNLVKDLAALFKTRI